MVTWGEGIIFISNHEQRLSHLQDNLTFHLKSLLLNQKLQNLNSKDVKIGIIKKKAVPSFYKEVKQ